MVTAIWIDLAEVYRNETPDQGTWLQIDLAGRASNRHGVDAQLEIATGDRRQLRDVRTGTSYQSQGAMSAHFGLAAAVVVDRLAVRWPSGKRQLLERLPVNRRVRIGE